MIRYVKIGEENIFQVLEYVYSCLWQEYCLLINPLNSEVYIFCGVDFYGKIKRFEAFNLVSGEMDLVNLTNSACFLKICFERREMFYEKYLGSIFNIPTRIQLLPAFLSHVLFTIITHNEFELVLCHTLEEIRFLVSGRKETVNFFKNASYLGSQTSKYVN